jgi:hypothetical protein
MDNQMVGLILVSKQNTYSKVESYQCIDMLEMTICNEALSDREGMVTNL